MRLVLIVAAIFAISVALLSIRAEAASEEQIKRAIAEEALAQGVDPLTALAVAQVESSFDPKAVGSLGEVGLFQLRPEFFAIEHGDIKGNIEAGVANLKRMKALCGPKYGTAFFVCHNTGPNKRLTAPKKTLYFKKVEQAKRELAPNVIAYDE